MPRFCTPNRCLASVGTVCVLLGTGVLLLFPTLLSVAVQSAYLGTDPEGRDNLVLRMYREPPVEIRLQVFTFSLQNEAQVLDQGAKPVLAEKGPYTFRIEIQRSNVTFTHNSTRLSSRSSKTYFFDPERSCADCSLDDSVTVPNILRQKLIDLGLASLADKEAPFVTVPVRQWLFEGYQSQLLATCKSSLVLSLFCGRHSGRIGLFRGQNGTDDGVYEVGTGLHEGSQLGRLYSWRGMESRLGPQHWWGERARMLNGTDGLLPPNNRGQPLQIFIGAFCRSFDLTLRGERTFSGIPVRRYTLRETLLDTEEQRAQGFCNPSTAVYFRNASLQPEGCAPSGLLDLSTCLQDGPRLYLSASHFRNSPQLRSTVEGMSSPSLFDLSFYDVEPTTGAIVHLRQRFQLNLGVLNGKLQSSRNLRDMVVPLIWVHQTAALDADSKGQLLVLLNCVKIARLFGWGVLTLGCGVLAARLLPLLALGRRLHSSSGVEGVKYNRKREEVEMAVWTTREPSQDTASIFTVVPL